MRMRKIHQIIVNDRIVDQSTKIEYILNALKEIRKTIPTAYMITTYC